jgi:2-polyprenyl-6-methoxyphenol hydroxylase-like FAD-dependent oxidoreductase
MISANRERAVVLGGSVAGLLAARVLADRYAGVTVVERDRLPSGAQHRRGLPHGRHVHGMLPRGRQILEELMPGLTRQVLAAGGLTGDVLADIRWYLNGRMLRRADTGLTALSASRPLIEAVIRQRVLALPNVTVLDGHDVTGLCAAPDGGRITGAVVGGRTGEGRRTLPADLVVDATGRGSPTPRWLADLGYPPPAVDRVFVDLSYSSCVFAGADGAFGDDLVVVTARFPGQRRSAVMQRLEGGRVLVTLAGVLGERPPDTLDGFARYADTLAAPDTAAVIRAGRPTGPPAAFRYPAYLRRRYELMPRFPGGLLVTGDASCGFNPVYGQGMSVAAMNALALRDELRCDGGPDPRRYFAAVARTLEAPWRMAVGADLAMPGVTGPVLPPSPLSGEYLGRLQLAAAEDATLAAAFIRVTSLVDAPPALLRPEIVERVTRVPVS